jgi:type II secretion system protein G
MTQRRGFTLIELLVVIAIIGILSAIIVPAIIRAKDSANRSADMSKMNELRSALLQYKTDQGAYPPALLGYVTLYSTGPNVGQVIPADQLQGFLYNKRVQSIETFRPIPNRSAFNLTTNARWPGIEGAAAPCNLQAFDANDNGFVADTSLTGGDPTPTTNPNEALNFYRVSGFDVAEVYGPDGAKRWELRYALFWSNYGLGANGCTLGSASDDPRQLGYEDPPETTVVTWNSFYREGSTVPPANTKRDSVLFIGGAARPFDANALYRQAWRVSP